MDRPYDWTVETKEKDGEKQKDIHVIFLLMIHYDVKDRNIRRYKINETQTKGPAEE